MKAVQPGDSNSNNNNDINKNSNSSNKMIGDSHHSPDYRFRSSQSNAPPLEVLNESFCYSSASSVTCSLVSSGRSLMTFDKSTSTGSVDLTSVEGSQRLNSRRWGAPTAESSLEGIPDNSGHPDSPGGALQDSNAAVAERPDERQVTQSHAANTTANTPGAGQQANNNSSRDSIPRVPTRSWHPSGPKSLDSVGSSASTTPSSSSSSLENSFHTDDDDDLFNANQIHMDLRVGGETPLLNTRPAFDEQTLKKFYLESNSNHRSKSREVPIPFADAAGSPKPPVRKKDKISKAMKHSRWKSSSTFHTDHPNFEHLSPGAVRDGSGAVGSGGGGGDSVSGSSDDEKRPPVRRSRSLGKKKKKKKSSSDRGGSQSGDESSLPSNKERKKNRIKKSRSLDGSSHSLPPPSSPSLCTLSSDEEKSPKLTVRKKCPKGEKKSYIPKHYMPKKHLKAHKSDLRRRRTFINDSLQSILEDENEDHSPDSATRASVNSCPPIMYSKAVEAISNTSLLTDDDSASPASSSSSSHWSGVGSRKLGLS